MYGGERYVPSDERSYGVGKEGFVEGVVSCHCQRHSGEGCGYVIQHLCRKTSETKLLHCGIDEILNKDNYESIKEILGHLAIGFNDAHAYKMEKRKGYFVSGDSARELVKDELINVAMWLFNTEKMDDHHIVALHDILEKYEMP